MQQRTTMETLIDAHVEDVNCATSFTCKNR